MKETISNKKCKPGTQLSDNISFTGNIEGERGRGLRGEGYSFLAKN